MQKGKLLALGTVLLLGACATGNGNTYYQLPFESASKATTLPNVDTAAKTPEASGIADAQGAAATPLHADSRVARRQLWIAQVSVADFLAGNGLVYQTSDVQYVTAHSNLWASPLEQQLQQLLVANLNAALPGTLISTQSISRSGEGDQLTVTINGFHGRYDGYAVIQGVWFLTHEGCVIRQPFNLTLPQEKDSYAALVRTLARGWQTVSQQVAKEFTAIKQ
ncbi:MAG: membrane integrity-associated transporter subunit PqiC [Sodalis sp. (in: enterobacteria)]